MLAFIGDLSIKDAELLAHLGAHATRILEFGSGGSTQILAHYSLPLSELISIETDAYWISQTRENLSRLGIQKQVEFFHWNGEGSLLSQLKGDFDLIFVDGIDHLRPTFYTFAWSRLRPGGILANHDTRRPRDFKIVADFIVQNENWLSVESLLINHENSNITLLKKGTRLEYVDWNLSEGKASWQYGQGRPPPLSNGSPL